MALKNNWLPRIFFFGILIFSLQSCSKDEVERPLIQEELTILTPDSTTIIRPAATAVDFSLRMAIDVPIDTLRAGFLIDTVGMTQNLTINDMDSVFLVTGFDNVNNIQEYTGSFTLPVDAYGIRPFRAYNPAFTDTADVVRIVFKMEAGLKTYEKQLKVIIE